MIVSDDEYLFGRTKNIAIRYWKFVLGPGLETPGVLPVGSMYAIYIYGNMDPINVPPLC